MGNIVVSSTVTTTQTPGYGYSVIVSRSGSIATTSADGIQADGANTISVSGEINTVGNAIQINGYGVSISVGKTGFVASNGGYIGIYVESGSAYIVNDGTIAAYSSGDYTAAIWGNNSSDYVVNSGAIYGSVYLGQGDNIFTNNGGSVSGKIWGGLNNDTLRLNGVQRDTVLAFDGQLGTDTLDARGFSSAVWVDLAYSGAEVWTKDDQDLNSGNPWRALADLTNVENVYGSNVSDFLRGDSSNNSFYLTGGVDRIDGRGGFDSFIAKDSSSALWIDLGYTGGAQAWTKNNRSIDADGTWQEVAHIKNVESITSTSFNDRIAGDDNDNTFKFVGVVDGGIDTYTGRGGSDTISFDGFGAAVWVDLAYSGLEAWTRYTAGLTSGAWAAIADLSTVENVTGSYWRDNLRGDSLDNRLEGGRSADTLFGAGGADRFVFDLASDQLETSVARDKIEDFELNIDKVLISGLNALPNIVIGAAPAPGSASPTLLYNTSTGVLSYDANGNLAGDPIEIAILTGRPALAASDFMLG